MKIAIFSDIHGNLEALVAVLQDIAARKCDFRYCLGDIVGYGANPRECLELIRANGIPAIKGNHDDFAATDLPLGMFNPAAAHAMSWTRAALTAEQRQWLSKLPYQIQVPEHGFCLYHANGVCPEGFEYIFSEYAAGQTIKRQPAPVGFIGHTHVPAIYKWRNGKPEQVDVEDTKIVKGCRYLFNVGSIGQPRDGNPQSCYAIYDTDAQQVNYIRLDYPLTKTQQKIIDAKLPPHLASRLATGK